MPSYWPSLPSAPTGCPILKNWEKQEADVIPALRALKPNWETSLDLRKEDQLSKSELEHRSAGGGKVGVKNLGPFLLLVLSCDLRPVINPLKISVSSSVRQIQVKVSQGPY